MKTVNYICLVLEIRRIFATRLISNAKYRDFTEKVYLVTNKTNGELVKRS